MFRWHNLSGNAGIFAEWFEYHSKLSGYSLDDHTEVVNLVDYQKFFRNIDTKSAVILFRYEIAHNLNYWKWVLLNEN